MKTRNLIATFVIVMTTAFTGAASANISTGSLGNDVQSVIGSGHVFATQENGVARLFGSVETIVDAHAAEMAAANFQGINKVISYITVEN